jgi:hypothetical protein
MKEQGIGRNATYLEWQWMGREREGEEKRRGRRKKRGNEEKLVMEENAPTVGMEPL